MTYIFVQLNLKIGELITIMNEKGEVFSGTYENDYNSNNESFSFNNFSNGQIETILIRKLQDLRRG